MEESKCMHRTVDEKITPETFHAVLPPDILQDPSAVYRPLLLKWQCRLLYLPDRKGPILYKHKQPAHLIILIQKVSFLKKAG